jgi:L,D-transpeptidase-like protein
MRLVRPAAALLAAGLLTLSTPSSAKILIEIDKSAQRMTVVQDGARLYTWPVSTGISRYDTPGGSYTPFRMERDHFSREWDDAPMPNSIFFTRAGHAIHGSYHRSIGRPASHGCVRLSVQNSRVLFDLVKREGMANTRVVLFGAIPYGGEPETAQRAPRQWQETRQPGYYQRSDNGAAPTPYGRPIYRGRYPDGSPVYDDRDPPYQPPPQPFFFPGTRSPWN